MTTEKNDARELSGRSYFAIGAVLGMAASVAIALLVFIVVATASGVKDAVASSQGTAVESSTPGDTAAATGDAGAGKNLTVTCVACHSTNGSDGVGPTWAGLAGSQRTLTDGSTVTADDAYLLESIVEPGAKVVDGFSDGLMPGNFGDTFSEDELEALVAYIKSL